MAKSNCGDCVWRGKAGSLECCDYFLRTGRRRPSPPGEGCTVKIARKVLRRRKKEEIKYAV